MTGEPYPTEWMDLDQWPGPRETSVAEDAQDAFRMIGEALVEQMSHMYTNLLAPAFDAFASGASQMFRGIEATMAWIDELEPSGYTPRRPPVQDRDKPAGITRHPHGPYERSRYTLQGQRRY